MFALRLFREESCGSFHRFADAADLCARLPDSEFPGVAVELGVLFCDQVGSTALLTRLGDALAEEVRRDVFEVLHRAADLSRGEVIKEFG